MTFKEDLKDGEEAEKLASEKLLAHFRIPFKKHKTIEFDLISPILKVEVKHDKMALDTDNIAIEYEYKGRPSGIKNTKANLWCYVIDGEVYICSTQKLIEYLQVSEYITTCGGDGKKSRLILLPIDEFKKLFIKI